MKKTKCAAIILLILAALPVYSGSAGDDIPVGSIEFVSSARCEVIIAADSESALATASPGSVLFALSGKERILLTVKKSEGWLIRCTYARDKAGKLLPAEGARVFYSEKDNAGKRYGDVKVVLSKLIKLHEEFIFRVESTDDPVRIADAVNELADSLQTLNIELGRLDKKYPELRNFTESPPAELRSEVELIRALALRLGDAMYKVRMFESDEAVKQALEKLKKATSGSGSGNE